MNILDVSSLCDMFEAASTLADTALSINNHEINQATLTYMSDIMYAMGRVVPTVVTLVEYRDLFGESAYNHITVERKDEDHYVATFRTEFNEDICKEYGIPSVLERSSLGSDYEEARTHVVLQLMTWIESLKCKNPSIRKKFSDDLINIQEKLNKQQQKDCEKTNLNSASSSSNSDIDDGMYEAMEAKDPSYSCNEE